jgi:hypothetical protein
MVNYKTSSPVSEKVHLLQLFEHQNRLVEHKFIHSSFANLIPDNMLSHVGDIYRELASGMTKTSYISEKLSYFQTQFVDDTEYFLIRLRPVRESPYYDAVRTRYMAGLKRLAQLTVYARIGTIRKRAMLHALRLQELLIGFYDNPSSQQRQAVVSEYEALVRALADV